MLDMYPEQIYNEISEQTEQGKGCIIFDFGLFFPYCLRENEQIVFRFKLGMNEMPEQKVNHRYRNKGYFTITRKKGRRLYKCGYPHFFDFKEGEPVLYLLCITFGLVKDGNEETIDLVFPLELHPTKEKSAFGLSLHLKFETGKLWFTSHEKDEKTIGWKQHSWSTEQLCTPYTPLVVAECDDESYTCIFVPSIKPFAQRPDELMI